MSLCIKYFATEGVGTTDFSGNSRWISGFTVDSWIHDGSTMNFWIRDGFLDSRWISELAIDSWIHDIFLDHAPLADLRIYLILASASKW